MSVADLEIGALPRLAARAQLGDRAALEELLRRLARQLRPHVEHLVGDRDLADDVLQDVLLRVARSLSSLREHAWVRAWAYRIATRAALRELGRSRRHELTSLDEAADVPINDGEPETSFGTDLLAQLPLAIESLPPASQTVVRLRYLDGLTQPEIAEALSIPVGTVKSRIAYGLGLLRVRMNAKQS